MEILAISGMFLIITGLIIALDVRTTKMKKRIKELENK